MQSSFERQINGSPVPAVSNGRSGGSPARDLRSEYINGEFNENPRSLRETVLGYAAARGALLAAGTPDYAAVIGLDRRMRSYLNENRERVSATPGLLAVMEYCARVRQESVFVKTIAETVSDLAEQRGRMFASYRDHSAAISAVSAKIEALVERSDQKQYLQTRIDDAERKGIKSVLHCEKFAAEAMRSVFTFKKDPEKIAQILEKMTPEERHMFRDTFEGRYKCDLITEMRKYFKGPARARIQRLMKGDDLAAMTHELYSALKSIGPGRAGRITEVLAKVAPEDKKQFEMHFMRRFDRFLHAGSFDALLDRFIRREDDRKMADYIREGKSEHAELYRIRGLLTRHNLFTRSAKLIEAIESLGSYENQRLFNFINMYRSEFGVTPVKDINRTRMPVEYKDCLNAILSFDPIGRDVTRLRCALSGIRTVWLGEIALNNTPEYLLSLRQLYERKYERDFNHDFRAITQTRLAPVRWFFGDEYQAIKCMFETGKLSNAELMGHCLFGPGTDEEGIKKIIECMGTADINQLKLDYAKRFPGRDLENDLLWELSGDDKFDIFEMMKGEPKTPEELMQRVEERYDYELNGPLAGRVQSLISRSGKSLSKKFQVIRKLIYQYEWEGDRLTEDRASLVSFYNSRIKDRQHSPDDLKRLDVLAQRTLLSASGFRQAENAIVEHAAHTAASISAAIAIPAGAFLTHSLTVSLLAGMAASMATRVSMKMSLKGVAYGYEEMIADSLRAGIAGSNVLAGRITARQLLQKVTGVVTKMGLGKLVNVTERVKKKSHHTHTAFILREAMADAEKQGHVHPPANGEYEIPASLNAVRSFETVWKDVRGSGGSSAPAGHTA